MSRWSRWVGGQVRPIVVAGIVSGVVVVGAGSRLAMLVLRLTSPEWVNGLQSDDGFEIGRFTVAGTYSLLRLGAFVGVLGSGLYVLVAPRLVGPGWFRDSVLAVGSAAVVGSILVHDDGIDFAVLTPTWLAVALFVALPAVFAVAVAHTTERCRRPGHWTGRDRLGWLLPIALLAAFPPALVAAGAVAAVSAVAALARRSRQLERVAAHPIVRASVTVAWVAPVAVGLVALGQDVAALAR